MSNNEKVKFCGKCGYTLVNGVCPACGNKQYDPLSPNKPTKNNSNKMIAIIAITAVVIIGILIAVFVSMNREDSSVDSSYTAESRQNDNMYNWITSVINEGPTMWENVEDGDYIILSEPYNDGETIYVNIEWREWDYPGQVVQYKGDYAVYFEYEQKSIINKVWLIISDEYSYDDYSGQICWDYSLLEWEQDSDGYISQETYHGNYM